MTSTIRASDFIAAIGVNTHLGYSDSSYRDTKKSLEALRYLGIDHVRDGAVGKMLGGRTAFATFAEAGVKFDLVYGNDKTAPAEIVRSVSAFARANPGAIVALEGPNEINIWPVTYGGLTGPSAAVGLLDTVIGLAKADPALAGADFYDLTGAPRSALAGNASEFANMHPYPQNGAQPGAVLATRIADRAVAGKGTVITEAGYHTGVGSDAWEGVDEATQAKLTLNLLMDAAQMGVSRTYLYQLLDGYADPTGAKAERHLGLFDTSFRPKAAAVALHNLTSILDDEALAAATFTRTALDYALSGLPASGKSLDIEKANGVHNIVLWAEPDIWDEARDRPIEVAPTVATLDFKGARVDVRLFDPTRSDEAIAIYEDVTALQVAIADHPVIVEVSEGIVLPVDDAPASPAPPMTLRGTAAGETLRGGAGADRLTGNGGHDTLMAAGGNDFLIGGAGADTLTGGSGADRFVYAGIASSTVAESGRDRITDFRHADGDRIDLAAIDANVRLTGDQAFHLGGTAFTRSAGELIQVATGKDIVLMGDVSGDGKADFAILLQYLTTPLFASDLLL